MTTNEERIAELMKQAGEDEKARKEAGKRFNIDDFTIDPEKIQEEQIEDLGTIQFKLLTAKEVLDTVQGMQGSEAIFQLIHKMLSKADPSITLEKVHKLHPAAFQRLVSKIPDFLLRL